MSTPSRGWELAAKALRSALVRVLYIWGPPGVGKTFSALNFGRAGDDVFSVTITEDTSAAEVRGHFIFKGGDAVWHDGPFVRAMRAGLRLVINEISNATADVLQILMPIFESVQTARLTLPTGETVRPAPGFHVVLTDNKPPEELPAPLRDRFTATVEVTEPHPDAFLGLSPELRELAQAGLSIDDDRRISARGWLDLQQLMGEFGLEDACLLRFGEERGQMLCDAIKLALAVRKRSRTG